MKTKANRKQNEARLGAYWWENHASEYNEKSEHYGKYIAVTGKGIVGAENSLELLIKKMNNQGMKALVDYYATSVPTDEQIEDRK